MFTYPAPGPIVISAAACLGLGHPHFVWGRTRLPATPQEWGDVRFTLHTRHTSTPDQAYPVAHTCFFSLELPA